MNQKCHDPGQKPGSRVLMLAFDSLAFGFAGDLRHDPAVGVSEHVRVDAVGSGEAVNSNHSARSAQSGRSAPGFSERHDRVGDPVSEKHPQFVRGNSALDQLPVESHHARDSIPVRKPQLKRERCSFTRTAEEHTVGMNAVLGGRVAESQFQIAFRGLNACPAEAGSAIGVQPKLNRSAQTHHNVISATEQGHKPGGVVFALAVGVKQHDEGVSVERLVVGGQIDARWPVEHGRQKRQAEPFGWVLGGSVCFRGRHGQPDDPVGGPLRQSLALV